MFSFHKPKIYRSHLGCCICKAKSSSSRFTDSKKYENEFEHCFRIQEKRSGEICNACVLLVKRWKKLSPESRLTKHWHHVVDARAGPGTKLTSTRRLIGSASTTSSSADSMSSGASSGAAARQQARKSDILPLSLSSQVNNQTTGMSSSNSSTHKTTRITNKARAIDTNVSHFTFGEPYQCRARNYMLSEHQAANNYGGIYSNSSNSVNVSNSLAKPQSALNSSAFESVIKRFRQRQQQQQLDARRRELNRQQRQQKSVTAAAAEAITTGTDGAKSGVLINSKLGPSNSAATTSVVTGSRVVDSGEQLISMTPPMSIVKRIKRSSSEIIHLSKKSGLKKASDLNEGPLPTGSSLNADLMRICSVLDSSIWRKEKICCGYIFRGIHNEVAIVPKLLKPCKCRNGSNKSTDATKSNCLPHEQQQQQQQQQPDDVTTQSSDETEAGQLLKAQDQADDDESAPAPPPRATKSGSISSCDSNTSGTGSMEQPLDEIAISGTSGPQLGATDHQAPAKTGANRIKLANKSCLARQVPGRKQRRLHRQQHSQMNDNDTSSSSSSSSSSRLMMLATDEEDGEEEEMILDEEELSNDASSSIESLADKETGQVAN